MKFSNSSLPLPSPTSIRYEEALVNSYKSSSQLPRSAAFHLGDEDDLRVALIACFVAEIHEYDTCVRESVGKEGGGRGKTYRWRERVEQLLL